MTGGPHNFKPINFTALASALLGSAKTLLPNWLPGGKAQGKEWVCGSLQGGEGGSCSVNMNTGAWADFASGEQGGDLVSLYAAIHGLSNGKAAVQVARESGLEDVAGVQRDGAAPAYRPAEVKPVPPPAAPVKPVEGWTTVRPVPAHAPAATYRHHHRQSEDIEHVAAYEVGGELHGYVVRFRTSDGGKETLPYTWCTSQRDGASRWHWRTWDEPRPLFFPGRALPAGRTVVLVEGEKKGELLHAVLEAATPGVYCVASWPGGCKAWKKADWSWLAGAHVLLWPDCDAKREPLTSTERKETPDKVAQALLQEAKPLLPPAKQPGLQAMVGIGHHLRGAHACTVQMLPIPAPGAVADGWDCGDAIKSDGWDADRVLAFFGEAGPLPEDDGQQTMVGGGAKPPEGTARDRLSEAGDGDDAFADHVAWLCQKQKCEPHELAVNRTLLITALRKSSWLKDCIGFDELRGAPSTRVQWPWRDKAGPLEEADDLRLGDWLAQTYKLRAASRAALTEAMDTVADQRRFHPIRDWLEPLQHDGKPRLDKWLIHVLGMDPATVPPRRRKYLEKVGRFVLMGLVARVMNPGCKFDYSMVLEGLPGVGKSTFVKELVGLDFFSDTHFDIGDGTRGMEQLEGLWAYELSELTAFKRADSEQIKQFFSSTTDRFRGAYGKYVQQHPRQCLIFCTTNKRQYLYDLTGNRRFWPVWISQPIKIEWLRKWREQLFAEALAAYRAGEAYTPTREEEEACFVPEQKARLVETAVQARLYELLTREGAPSGEGRLSNEINNLCTFVTLNQLVSALGADPAKSTTILEGQIRGWLESYGWESHRESSGQRRRGYRAPDVWPPVIEDDEPDLLSPPATGENIDGTPAQADSSDGGDHAPF